MKSSLLHLLWILLGIPFLIYPGILIAGVMSIAAPKNKVDKPNYGFKFFLYTTIGYPLIYFLCYKYFYYFLEYGSWKISLLLLIPPLLVSGMLVYVFRKPS